MLINDQVFLIALCTGSDDEVVEDNSGGDFKSLNGRKKGWKKKRKFRESPKKANKFAC